MSNGWNVLLVVYFAHGIYNFRAHWAYHTPCSFCIEQSFLHECGPQKWSIGLKMDKMLKNIVDSCDVL
jgi:hypothetical protein